MQGKGDFSVLKRRLNSANREFNSVGKRIENLGLSKEDYATIEAILKKQYQDVMTKINNGQEVPGVTDVLDEAANDRQTARDEKKAKRTARLTELKGKATLTAEETAEVAKLEKALKVDAAGATNGTEAAAAAGQEGFV